jgi:ABC-type branched-subunit amino acid transport system substrate-binding protein
MTLVTVAAAACGSSAGSGSQAGNASGTVPIGVITSLTGSYSVYGAPFENGVTYAVQQINQSGGFVVNGKHYKFAVTTENDNTSPATAVQKATGLISTQKAVAIFGPIGAQGPAVEQLTTQGKVINFSSSSSVATTAGPPKNPMVFMTDGSAQARVDAVVNAIKSFVPGVNKVAVLGPEEETDAAIIPVLNSAFSKAGITMENFNYPVGTTDLSSVLTRLVAAKPQVVLMGWAAPDRQTQAQQFAAAGLPSSTAEFLYAGTISECQADAHGRPCIADPLAGADLSSSSLSAANKQWVSGFEAFTKTTSLSPQIEATLWTYDFPFMLAQAMSKAGTVTDTTAIANALRGSITRKGLLGTITFDQNNNAVFGFDETLVTPSGATTTKHFT